MAGILDGLGEIITDGSGNAIFDGGGLSSTIRVTETSDLDPFIQRIQEDIPGAPEFVIKPHLRRIIREFTEKSWVLYQGFQVQGSGVQDSIYKSVAWDMADYASGLEPFGIKDLKDGSCQYKAQKKVLMTEVPDSRYKITGVKFFEVFRAEAGDDKTSIRVFPFDVDEPLLSMMVAFKTQKDASAVPEVLVDDWLEQICSGAMARMMAQPEKPWTDPKLALFHKNEYQSGISKAKLQWFQNNSRSYAVGKRFI